AAPPMTDAEIGMLTPPPAQELSRLIELADRGLVSLVLNELARLEEADPRLGAWIGQVRAVARSFQTKRLRGLLQAQLDTASRSSPERAARSTATASTPRRDP
ncbi:MAG TPA: hypothetical protein VL242_42255, partial [Sorangium sp.]|nr:hypothetical protein [Sorangium sp.]